MTLLDKSLKRGSLVRITNFAEDNLFRERLHEMGLRVGTQLTVLGRAPFRGPILVKFKTSFLALRQEEAACAQVSPL